ncbi:MAG: tetratricopeptide repeat protein, partial [bacterium]
MKGYRAFSLALLFLISSGFALPQEKSFQEGERYFREKDYGKAINIFKGILDRMEWDEFSLKSALRLGQCYAALSDYENARRFFNLAKKGEGDVKWEAMIGIGIAFMGEKNYDSAIDALSEVISQCKTDKMLSYAYYNRGLAYKGKGWMIKALSDFRNAKRKAKGEEELLKAVEKELRECEARYEEFKSAEASYLLKIQNAQNIGDMDGCAHLLRDLASLCESWGDIDKAIEYEREAISYSSVEEFKAGSLMSIAWRYFKLKEYEKAAEYFKEVVDEYPRSTQGKEALLRFGDMMGYLGKQDEAINIFTSYINMYPNDPDIPSIKMKIAWCYYNKGDYERAAEAFRKVVEEYPQRAEAKDALMEAGNSYAKAGRNEEAIKCFQAFIERYPDDKRVTEAMMNLAWRYRAVGNLEKTNAILNELNKRLPDSELGWFALGLMYELEGGKDPSKFEEGVKAYLKAAGYFGDQRPLSLLGAANCLLKIKRYNAALQATERLLKEYPEIYEEAAMEAEWLRIECFIGLKYPTDKIISSYHKLAEKSPYSKWGKGAQAQIVYIYLKAGEMELAQREEEKLIKRYKDCDPDFVAQTIYEWGRFLYGKGEYKLAGERFKEVLEMSNALKLSALLQLALCYQGMADYDSAINGLGKILVEGLKLKDEPGLPGYGWI